MKPKLYLTLLSVITILAVSCKTASKLYEKGNYDEAVVQAAKKLQKDPADPQLFSILQNAYHDAVNDHENRVREDYVANNELKWEEMYNEYASLQRLYEAIYKVPQVFNIVQPIDYYSYLNTYKEKAGDIRYQRGLALMQHPDKQNYRQAYGEFQVALRFLPGDRDVTEKMNESYEYAVTNVAVLPMQQDGGFVYSSYTVGGNNLDDQVIHDLQYNSGNEFVRFFSAWDARSRHIRLDQELDLRLTTVDMGRYHDSRTTRKVSRQIVTKETVFRPDSVVREYSIIYAEITTTKRTMNSHALLQVNLRDENGRWLWSDDIPADHTWCTEFSTFTGDERALSDADKELINRRRDFSPTETDLMRSLLDQLNNTAPYRIRNYFARF